MDVEIPLDLIEQLHKGNVVPFVGAGVSVSTHGQRGLPSGSHLAAQLADRCGYTESDRSLAKVAQYYDMKRGRHSLVSYIQECVDDPQYTPLFTHQLIARLPFKVIVTTNWDRLLERAFETASKPYTLVVRNEEITYLDPEKVTLVKMHGSIEQPDSLIITVDDYWDFFSQLPTVSSILKAEFATKTLLFIGYSLEDDNFQRLYTDVTREVDRHKRRAYAVQWQPSDYAIEWWRRKEVQIIEADATEFLRELETKLDEFRAKAEGVAKPILTEEIKLIPKRPYKFLDYFEEGDEDIFFGREKEIAELCSKVVSHRLVVLSGRSGVGKTSLLRAGVGARLRREGYTLAHVRLLADPTQELTGAVYRALPESQSAPKGDEFYPDLQIITADLEMPLIICLDQFEEFFIRQGQAVREGFARQLGRCVADGDLPVKFVIAVRADFLGELGTLQAQVPSLFNNVYTLAPLTEVAARQAIVEPARRYGVSYEARVVEKLLRALEKEGVEPPQLQIVCDRLYDERNAKGQITLARYEELGSAAGILAGHLERVLDERFAPDERSLAEAVLKALVTSLETKAVSTLADIQREARGEEEAVASVLTRLEVARLVRRVATEQGVGYELAHEYLVDRIGGWIDAEERALKKVREMLRRAVANWQSHNLMMDTVELDLLDPHRERLYRLDPVEQELLLRSALVAGHEASAYWLEQVEDETQRTEIARDCLADGRTVVRGWTAQVLSAWDAPVAREMLVGVALNDDAALVRQQAAESLRTMEGQRKAILTSLLAAAQSPDRQHRRSALEALSYMPLSGVGLRLRMQVLATRLRLWTAQANERVLRRYGATVGTAAILVLIVMAIYALLGNSYYVGVHNKGETDPSLQRIVVQSGYPALRFLPGFDRVVIETDFTMAQVHDKELRSAIWNETLTGLWWQKQDDHPRWWGEVLDKLALPSAGIAWRESGDTRHAVECLTAALGDEDYSHTRWVTAQALGIIGQKEPDLIIPELQAALSDTNPAIRLEAASVLVAIAREKPDPVVSALIDTSHHEDWGVRHDAVQTLGRIGPEAKEAVPALCVALDDEYGWVREEAARALGTIGATELMPELVMALSDGDWNVRQAAAGALGEIGPEAAEAVPELRAALSDENEYVRQTTARALGKIGSEATEAVPELRAALSDENEYVRQAAAEALGEIGPGAAEAVPELIVMLNDGNEWIRWEAAKALGMMEATEAVPKLIVTLSDENEYVRQAATETLGEIAQEKPEVVVPDLMRALRDWNTTWAAAQALGEIGRGKPDLVVPELVMTLDEVDPIVPQAAAKALGEIGPGAAEAVPKLQALLRENPVLSQTAARVLGKIGPEAAEAVPELRAALSNENEYLRQAAAEALGEIGPGAAEAVPELQALLDDENLALSLAAARALGKIGPEAAETVPELIAIMLSDGNEWTHQVATEALGEIAQEKPEVVVPALQQALEELEDGHYWYACQAATEVLRQIEPGAVEAVPTLQKMLEHECWNVREAAAWALVQIGPGAAEAIPTLQQALKNEDPYVRQASAQALGEIGPKAIETVPSLRKALGDENLYVRKAAAETLSVLYHYLAQEQEAPLTFLLAKLHHPLDSNERSITARAIFLLILEKPNLENEAREVLAELQDPQQPHVYVTASRTLAMLDVADLLREAQAHPENLKDINERLKRYEQLHENYFPHLRFAAEKVQERLEKIYHPPVLPRNGA